MWWRVGLLADTPNYRQSLLTKVVEYLARGVPVVTTPNPRSGGEPRSDEAIHEAMSRPVRPR